MQAKLGIPALVACLVVVACSPRDAEIRRARVTTERRNLEAALDRLEDRLVLNQSRVRFWGEMKDRHESVTAIACASMEEHAADMAENLRRSRSGGAVAHRSLDRARVASLRPAASEAPAAPSVSVSAAMAARAAPVPAATAPAQ